MKEPWQIYLLVFGAAVLAFEGLYWLAFRLRSTQKAINRRLFLSQKTTSRSKVLDMLREERGFADFPNPFIRYLNDLIVQTGLKLSRSLLILMAVAISGLIGVFAAVSSGGDALIIAGGIAGGALLGPLVVVLILQAIRARRIAQFTAQLPDAIDTIVRGLRVGHPFSTAIELVAREHSDPIGTEFGIASDEITFGQDFVTAVNNLSRRVGQDDLLFLIIAVSVQSQTGGNLAEVLSRLARLIRERDK